MSNPRKFLFQLQFSNEETESRRESHVAEFVRIIKSCGGNVMETSVGQEDGEFFANISAETQESYAFWRDTKTQLTASPPPKTLKMIVVCEGDDSWNDYHLLYHFDKTQPIEELTQQA